MSTDRPSSEPRVGGREYLFRRIPVKNGSYSEQAGLAVTAFAPNRNDTTGLSASRSGLGRTPEDEARDGRLGTEYYVAVIDKLAAEESGVMIDDRPVEGNPSHVEFPAITHETRRTDDTKLMMQRLKNATVQVVGPFQGQRAVTN